MPLDTVTPLRYGDSRIDRYVARYVTMPFVKLDCSMLSSSIWPDRPCRELFITALLMAHPLKLAAPQRQIAVDALEELEFVVPPGEYGIVEACGRHIIHVSGLELKVGLEALRKLGEPDPDSRSKRFDGRRMVRVDGGYIVLNYGFYRDKDYTAATRQKRYRDRTKERNAVTGRNVTQAEAYIGTYIEGSGPVEPPPHFPKTREEAIASAEMVGVPPDYAGTHYDLCVSRGYADRNGLAIHSWPHHVKAVYEIGRGKDAEKVNSSKAKPAQTKSAWEIKATIDAIESELSDLEFQGSYEGPHGREWNDDAAKKKWFELKRRVKALTAELAGR